MFFRRKDKAYGGYGNIRSRGNRHETHFSNWKQIGIALLGILAVLGITWYLMSIKS